jgi:pimeloyl-ACP methyl ester carboxylesterase
MTPLPRAFGPAFFWQAVGFYWSEGFTIIPALGRLRMPTLIIHGDYDFVPIECATHIAGAISGARLVVVRDSGHFSYIDAPDEVRKVIGEFLDRAPSTA